MKQSNEAYQAPYSNVDEARKAFVEPEVQLLGDLHDATGQVGMHTASSGEAPSTAPGIASIPIR